MQSSAVPDPACATAAGPCGRIRLLGAGESARIRAGEVVERPASLAKELLENAMDAGATRITVRCFGDKGQDSIIVEDDGGGIDPGDMGLLFQRHATSKLGENADPAEAGTYGFRGEALASAAAFADSVTVTSRTAHADAHLVRHAAGRTGEVVPTARGRGTTVRVDGLFAHHPARLGFLRSPRQESALVRDAVELAAISRPDAWFSLEMNGRTLLSLQPDTLHGRLRSLRGSTRSAGDSEVFPIELPGVRGLVWLRPYGARGEGRVLFHVNGRPVRGDRVMLSGFSAGLARAAPGRIADADLLVELPRSGVDANVHPAKTEVRFRDPEAVRALVSEAVAGALSRPLADIAPAMPSARALAAMAAPLAERSATDATLLPLGRAIGMVPGGYLVCETTDGMVLVDAHAAHERVLYETMLASGGTPAVDLPSPRPVTLPPGRTAALEGAGDALERAGFRGYGMDEDCFVVSGAPDGMDADAVPEAIRALGEAAFRGDLAEESLYALVASSACRAAWRRGRSMEEAFPDWLLRSMEALGSRASRCQHGRPTWTRVGQRELGALFGRR